MFTESTQHVACKAVNAFNDAHGKIHMALLQA